MSKPIEPFTFSVSIDPSLAEKDFVKEAARQAREHFRHRHAVVISKGGRPSLENLVYRECDKIWESWGERFPRNQSMQNLIQSVARKIPGNRKDLTTVKRYVQKWMGGLTLDEVPDGWIRTPEGKRQIRMQLAFAIVGQAMVAVHGDEVIQAAIRGNVSREATAPRQISSDLLNDKTVATVANAGLSVLRSISDKELARRFIESRQQKTRR